MASVCIQMSLGDNGGGCIFWWEQMFEGVSGCVWLHLKVLYVLQKFGRENCLL